MKRALILAALLCLAATTLHAGKYNKIQTAPAEYLEMENEYTSESDLARGKRYYDGKCAECHGEEGEGDGEGATAFNDTAYMKAKQDGQLFYTASEGNGEDAEMEGYGPESDAGMSEKKIWQMISYIRTLAK